MDDSGGDGEREVVYGQDVASEGPFPVACPAPDCDFVSESRSRLSNARRTLWGHVLRQHRAAVLFDVRGGGLQELTAPELQGRLEAFHCAQMNGSQRRRRGRGSGSGGRPLASGAIRASGDQIAAGVGGVASASLPRAGAVSGHVTPPSGAA